MKKLLLTCMLLTGIALSAQINNEHLNIGDQAPLITGKDQNGKGINSAEILKNNKILLVFYRGNWCPHCRKHLTSLQDNLNDLNKKGYFVIVVTPENYEKTQETADKLSVTFSILHDQDNSIMNNYKVAYNVNKENIPNFYPAISKKLAEYNGNNSVLPVPATYIIDRNNSITYVQYDPDYKNRSDFKEILKM